MTEHPPRKVRVLTNLRINEISMVDKGAGRNCKVLISKRDDSADGDDVYQTDWYREQAAIAECQNEEHLRESDDERKGRFLKYFRRKSYAADARGDDGDGNSHHASQVADLLVESGKHPDRQSALDHLLHNPRGAAMLQRLSKSEDSTPMSLDLSSVIKTHGIGALCRHIIKSASSFGIDEHQLVSLATEDANRRYPSDTPAMAFSKLFMESSELREAIEIAKGAALQDAVAAEIEKDSRAAMDELVAIGKARWPNLSPSQRFARAFETNSELAKRAHRRPGPSTSFAHPVAKNLAAPVVDPKPIFVGDDVALDVDDPRAAVEQLKEQGRSRWPSASALEQFERALTDPENAELVRVAFATPTGSSPPRR
jgi:hypothetical protein